MRTPQAIANWKVKMSEVGPDGLTGFQRRGKAIKEARLKNGSYTDQGKKISASLGEEGLRNRAKKIHASIDQVAKGLKISATKISKRTDSPSTSDRLKWYRNKVVGLTRLVDVSDLEHFDKRGKGYDLDHKFSIRTGFDLNIPPEILARKVNLEFIPTSDNIRKGKSCSITLEELMEQSRD